MPLQGCQCRKQTRKVYLYVQGDIVTTMTKYSHADTLPFPEIFLKLDVSSSKDEDPDHASTPLGVARFYLIKFLQWPPSLLSMLC
jgi:hypothetical protein